MFKGIYQLQIVREVYSFSLSSINLTSSPDWCRPDDILHSYRPDDILHSYHVPVMYHFLQS